MNEKNVDSIENFNELTPAEQQTLLDWCQTIYSTKTINKNHTSYGLKSYFEKSSKGFYITNGAFKGAMVAAGFNHYEGNPTKNWYFNISEKSIKNLK